MTIAEILADETKLPVVYSHFKDTPKSPPYIAYIGAGQNDFEADDTYFHKSNRYQVEYYFTQKNEEAEESIETALLKHGYLYDKSEDIFIEGEGVFVIYYNI